MNGVFDQARGAILAFWRWWIGELVDLWQALLPANRSVHVYQEAARVRVDRSEAGQVDSFVDPRPLSDLDPDSWQELAGLTAGARTTVVLAPPQSWSTSVRLPKAAQGRLRSAVSLQLLEVAPLSPEQLIWTHRTIANDTDSLTVRITAVRRDRVAELGELFEANGLRMPSVSAVDGETLVRLQRAEGAASLGALTTLQRQIGLAVGVILATPLLIWAGASLLAASIASDNAALAAKLAPKVADLAEARRAARLRAALAEVAAQPAVTTVIEEVAARLPSDSHVLTASARGDGNARLVLATPEPTDAVKALTSGRHLPTAKVILAQPDPAGGFRAEVVVAVR